MTRRTYVYDADADAMIQVRGPGSNYYEPQSGLQIIRDIDPYRAAGSDKNTPTLFHVPFRIHLTSFLPILSGESLIPKKKGAVKPPLK